MIMLSALPKANIAASVRKPTRAICRSTMRPHFPLSRWGQDDATWLVRLQMVHSIGENEGGFLARPRPFALGG